MCQTGDCYLIETNHDSFGYIQNHLFVLILECEGDFFVIVNLDKVGGKRNYDATTVLNPGDGHGFITEFSYVNYQRARLVSKEELNRLVREGIAKHYGVMDESCVERIRRGIPNSRYSNYEVREAYNDLLFGRIN